jgi:hypothetical protein
LDSYCTHSTSARDLHIGCICITGGTRVLRHECFHGYMNGKVISLLAIYILCCLSLLPILCEHNICELAPRTYGLQLDH